MKNNLSNWEKTIQLYINWFSKTPLRNFFSENIKIGNFSIWWATSLSGKDNMIYNRWFYDLKDTLFERKKIEFSKNTFYLLFTLKLLKNFFINFMWFFLIKLISFSRLKNIDRENCFHSYYYNFWERGNFLFDRLYGKAPFFKNKSNNFHVISIIKKKYFFKNYFKKKYIPCVVADEFMTLFDFIHIYFKTLINFFKLKKYLNENKNFFIIKGINCRKVLEPYLLLSFAGEIQNSLLRAISIKNFLRKNKIKFFISYGEFAPGYRPIYFFAKDFKNPPTIVSIQHSMANKSLLFCLHKKNEFTKNKKLQGKYFSPSPDFFLTQGKQYDKTLKTFFPQKTKIIGSLRFDMHKFKEKISSEIYRIKFKKENLRKKIILICPSIGDELDVLHYTKNSYNFNYRYILSPHPIIRRNTIGKFLDSFKNKLKIEIYDNVSTTELLSISDYVICGFSSVGYEALFYDAQSIRVVNSNNPPFFDLKDGIMTAKNPQQLKKILGRKNIYKSKKAKINKLKKYFFYKLDNQTHLRFWNFINSL